MQIALFSDTHSEFRPWVVPELPDVDVVVIAGDLGSRPKHYDDTLAFMRAKNSEAEIITVLGNHEFYAGPPLNDRSTYHTIAKVHGAVLLDNSEVTVGGYTFVGGTLWTDVAAKFNTIEACSMLNDYDYISVVDESPERASGKSRDLRVEDISREHKQTIAKIREVLGRRGERTIVITHHAPSYQSCMQFRGDPKLNDFYATDYQILIEETKPIAWVHGHIHSSSDYTIGETRVICNPRGYAPNALNPKFLPLGARFEVPDLGGE